MGLRDRFPPLPAAVSQPAGARTTTSASSSHHNVKGIFEQDTYNTPHSELAALGGYLTAKFLWNPNYDAEQAIDEFLEGYYGKAAGPIRAYLDLLHDRVEAREHPREHLGPASTART